MDTATTISQLHSFARVCGAETRQEFPDHGSFHDFSVAHRDQFWRQFLAWSALAHEGSVDPVCTSEQCESARFFPNLRLSYAENLLLSDAVSDQVALTAHRSYSEPTRLTRGELKSQVLSLAARLAELGVGRGDRVVALAGNNAEAVVVALASATIGATFSSASPDMGVDAVLSRFSQLEPAVLAANLLAVDTTGPRAIDDRVSQLAQGLPSLKAVIALDDGPAPKRLPVPLLELADLLESRGVGGQPGAWPRFPFNHPLFVMFTSGTTGQPKCLVHGTGGTLLEHVKEHRLHVDLRPGERMFFHTTAAWMMWNWQLSALASGVELVLWDGPVTEPRTLWELVRAEGVNVFGTSPPFLQLCQDAGYSPGPLPQLRAVLSTGSILHDWQFDWVQKQLGPVALQSISGGTDIIGCFVLGNPDLPVRRGLIQCRSLAMDVQAMATDGTLAEPGAVGELVCRNPFPSRPLGFYGDEGAQFHSAYFEQHPGVWTHGDLIEFEHDGQIRMHGRSDGVLNIRGTRIGPAEIYRPLHSLDEIRESMAVELVRPEGHAEIALLVVLREGLFLDSELRTRIRQCVAMNASPAHAPSLIAQVDELPVTHSGKRSERAARDAVNGRAAGNPRGLANPECLDRLRVAIADEREHRRELEDAAGRSTDDTIQSRVIEIWEVIFGVPIGRDDNFFDLGGTSLMAVRLLQMIHERIGVELPPSVFIHSHTPAEIADLLEGPPERRAPILVPLRPGRDDRPLFLIHAMGGDVLHVRPLVQALDTERTILGLQARGLDPGQTPDRTVEQMANTYLELIRLVQPHGPYVLAGYSFGGLVAFELAQRLSAEGEPIQALVLIDSYLDSACLSAPARGLFLASRPVAYLRYVLADPRTRAPTLARNALRRLAAGRLRRSFPDPDEPRTPRFAQLERIGWKAFTSYRPAPYSGKAILFFATGRHPSYCNPATVWRRYVHGGLTRHRIGTNHGLVSEGSAALVARRLSDQLG